MGDEMAKCPKCGYGLKIWDIKAECPSCGVNIANYDWERRLEEDSIKAEAAFAKLHETMNKFKYSFKGTKLRIARIPVSVLPLFSFLLPLGHLSVSLPFYEDDITINAISLVMNIMKFDIGGIFKFPSSTIAGDAALMFVLALVLLIAGALSLLVSLVFLMLNFRKLNSKGLSLTNLVASLLILGSAYCFNDFLLQLEASTVNAASGSLGWGIFVSAGLFFASFVINMFVAKAKVVLPEIEKASGEEKQAAPVPEETAAV